MTLFFFLFYLLYFSYQATGDRINISCKSKCLTTCKNKPKGTNRYFLLVINDAQMGLILCKICDRPFQRSHQIKEEKLQFKKLSERFGVFNQFSLAGTMVKTSKVVIFLNYKRGLKSKVYKKHLFPMCLLFFLSLKDQNDTFMF